MSSARRNGAKKQEVLFFGVANKSWCIFPPESHFLFYVKMHFCEVIQILFFSKKQEQQQMPGFAFFRCGVKKCSLCSSVLLVITGIRRAYPSSYM
jgi:hypothetical protein